MKNSSLTPLLDRCANKFRAIRGEKEKRILFSHSDLLLRSIDIFYFRIKFNVNIFFFFLSFARRKYIGESVEQNWPR